MNKVYTIEQLSSIVNELYTELSNFITASPEEIKQKDRELKQVILDYIKDINSEKEKINLETDNIINEYKKYRLSELKDLTEKLEETKELIQKQQSLLNTLEQRKVTADNDLSYLTDIMDRQATDILTAKMTAYETEFNQKINQNIVEIARNLTNVIEDSQRLANAISQQNAETIKQLENRKQEIINDVIKRATEEIIKINPSKTYEINIGNWHSKFNSRELFHEKFEQVLILAAMKKPTLLKGPAGSGKNVIIEQVAKALNLNFYYINDVTDEFKILGFVDANGAFQKTQFFKAFTEGGVMFIDEIDNSNPSALLAINSAIGTGDSHYMAFPDGNFYKAHPDFRLIAAANTFGTGADAIYCGRQALDGASLNRFSPIIIDYDRNIEQSLTNNSRLLELYWHVRDIVNENDIRHVISTRNIINAVDFFNTRKFSMGQIFDMTLIQSLDTYSLNIIASKLNTRIDYASDLLRHLETNYKVSKNTYNDINNDTNSNGYDSYSRKRTNPDYGEPYDRGYYGYY